MIYTSICGGYDHPRNDIKCFSEYDKFKDPRLNAKIYKVLPHKFMPEEPYWIWCDGNLTLKGEYFSELMEMVGESDVAVFENPYRETVGEEMEEIKRLELDDPSIIDSLCYNKQEKLPACFLIIRKNTPEVRAMNERWWSEITTGSVRDQISFPSCYPTAKHLPKVHPFNNKYFERRGHKIPR